ISAMYHYSLSLLDALPICRGAGGTCPVVGRSVGGLEHPPLAVLADTIPGEGRPVHRHVDPRRKHLGKRQRAPEVEQPVRAAEGRSEEHTSELQSRENIVCR